MKKICAIFIVAIFATTVLSGLALLNTVYAYNVTGLINSDTIWTKANSPYSLTGSVGIVAGVTLRIEAGTVVNFNGYHLEVNGTLIAKGTSTDLIYLNDAYIFFNKAASWNPQTDSGSILENVHLTPAATEGRQQLMAIESTSPKITNNRISGVIEIRGSSKPTISQNIFTDGALFDLSTTNHTINNNIFNENKYQWTEESQVTAIYAPNSYTVTITNNTVSGGFTGIIGSGYIYNNYVSGCKIGISGWDIGTVISENIVLDSDSGISGSCIIRRNIVTGNGKGDGISTNGNATVLNNTITGHKNGIHIQKTDSDDWSTAPQALIAKYNNIFGNSEYNLRIDSFDNADAPYNWWGTTDTAVIDQKIYDYNDDYHLGKVTYIPFLKETNLQAPNPDISGGSVLFGLDLMQVTTVALLGVIAVLLTVAVVFLRKRKRK